MKNKLLTTIIIIILVSLVPVLALGDELSLENPLKEKKNPKLDSDAVLNHTLNDTEEILLPELPINSTINETEDSFNESYDSPIGTINETSNSSMPINGGNEETNSTELPIDLPELPVNNTPANTTTPVINNSEPVINETIPDINLTENDSVEDIPLRSTQAMKRKTYVLAQGKTVAVIDSGEVKFLHEDYLGSVRAITGFDEERSFMDFFPFGKKLLDLITPNDEVFAGMEKESLSGLSYVGARYYDEDLGRWISPDPIINSEAGTFTYVDNNPFKYVDPNGMDKVPAQQNNNDRMLPHYNVMETLGNPSAGKPYQNSNQMMTKGISLITAFQGAVQSFFDAKTVPGILVGGINKGRVSYLKEKGVINSEIYATPDSSRSVDQDYLSYADREFSISEVEAGIMAVNSHEDAERVDSLFFSQAAPLMFKGVDGEWYWNDGGYHLLPTEDLMKMELVNTATPVSEEVLNQWALISRNLDSPEDKRLPYVNYEDPKVVAVK